MKPSYKRYAAVSALALGMLRSTAQSARINQTYSGPLPVTLTGTLPNQGTALEQIFTLINGMELSVFRLGTASA